MRALVFTDETLARHAGRFVWLSLNGEKAANASLVKRLAIPGYPSFYVVNSADERIALRWVGSFNARQMPRLLDAGEVAVRGGTTPLDRLRVRADSLYAVGRDSASAEVYRQLLETAPPDYADRGRCLESLLFALTNSDRFEECASLAAAELPKLGRTSSAANAVAYGLDAAIQLPADHLKRAGWIATLDRAGHDFAADTTIEMFPDDRSGLYITLIGARDDAKDSLGVRRTTEAWSAFLDGAAARARTPDERTAYDSHRLSAYVDLGQAERAIPMLEQSERDFPGDYNPLARLAIAYRALSRWDEAVAASDRALSLAYGPRKITIYRTRVDIELGRGDKDGARRVLNEAIAYAQALPPGQRSTTTIASLQKRLDGLN
jgi:tetratricopeptide (TPR) repeat protein